MASSKTGDQPKRGGKGHSPTNLLPSGASDLLSSLKITAATPTSAPVIRESRTPTARPTTDIAQDSDRRRQRRIPFDDEIEIWQRGARGRADRYPAWGLNISSGGIRIILTRTLNEGERVGIQLRRDRHALPGRVAWVKPHRDGCVAGIAFQA